MIKIVGLAWMHKIITKTKGYRRIRPFCVSWVITQRLNYPTTAQIKQISLNKGSNDKTRGVPLKIISQSIFEDACSSGLKQIF